MSLFTKRRKVVRQKQEEQRKKWEENSKKFNKTCNDIIKACDYITKNHPEFNCLDGDDRVKVFGKIFNKIHNDT